MICSECPTELTGDSEYDFATCVACQSNESEETQVMEAIEDE